MTNYSDDLDRNLEEQEKILEKQAMLKRAMSLPPTTQDDVLEIARKILDSQKEKFKLRSPIAK